MSFGFSVDDFVSLGQRAWALYQACRNAPGEFQELSRELISLETTLRLLKDEAKSPNSLLNRHGTIRKAEMDTLVKNIKELLLQIEDIVKRYNSLGKDQKKTWDRIRFATEHLVSLREKVSFHINAINLFMSSLSASALARIEGVLDELVKDIKAGRKEPTVISACEEEDEAAWNDLERELLDDGITRQNVECHREVIKEYLKKLIQDNNIGTGSSSEASLSNTFIDLRLENGISYQEPYVSVPSGWIALHKAAESGHETVVRTLLKEGAEVAAKDSDGWTALHKAAENGHETVVRLLLKEGADINVEDWFGLTALHPAARSGRKRVVQLLLEKGADVAANDHVGRTALCLAAENGHEMVVRLLLEKGADVAAKDHAGRTALHRAAENGHEAVLQLLHENGTNVAETDNSGRTALHRTAEKGQEAVLRLLLEKGVEVTAADRNERTALHWAAENGHESVVRLLLQRGADVNATDNLGRTALKWALENSQEAIVRLLAKATTGGTRLLV